MVMTVDEVCHKLGCKRSRVFQLLRCGTLERAPRFGREIRIYTDTVERAQARPDKARRKIRVVGAPPPVQDSDRQW